MSIPFQSPRLNVNTSQNTHYTNTAYLLIAMGSNMLKQFDIMLAWACGIQASENRWDVKFMELLIFSPKPRILVPQGPNKGKTASKKHKFKKNQISYFLAEVGTIHYTIAKLTHPTDSLKRKSESGWKTTL